LEIELLLHASEGFSLSRLGNLALEFLRLNPLLQHRNLVFVKGFDCINHELLLRGLRCLRLLELSLLLQQLVLLQVGSKFVDALAEAHLLSISFVHEGLLLINKFFLKLFLLDQLELHLPGDLLLNLLLLGLPIAVLCFLVVLVRL